MQLVGNLIATTCVGIAVFLALQWRPDPHDDWTVMAAVSLSYFGGLLTALSSISKIMFVEEKEDTHNGDDN